MSNTGVRLVHFRYSILFFTVSALLITVVIVNPYSPFTMVSSCDDWSPDLLKQFSGATLLIHICNAINSVHMRWTTHIEDITYLHVVSHQIGGWATNVTADETSLTVLPLRPYTSRCIVKIDWGKLEKQRNVDWCHWCSGSFAIG